MPAAPPVAYATLSNTLLPSRPYILSITPLSQSNHLILRHPSSDLTIVDAQTLQPIDQLSDGHTGHVTDVVVDESGSGIWSSGKEGLIVRWDERSRKAGLNIKAFVRKPLPVLALAASESDNLVIGGTELVSSEAHILFWDIRNPKNPAYTHSSTHSDDITQLSLLPPTRSFLSSTNLPNPLPPRLLLSSSTDGLVALSDMRESDEDEAVQCAENSGSSLAAAGEYAVKGRMKVWGRNDMDGMTTWDISLGEEGLELQNQTEYPTETFKFRRLTPPQSGPSTSRTAAEERSDKSGQITSDYLIDAIPSLGVSRRGAPITAVGTNEGDIVLLHNSAATNYEPSAFFLTHPTPNKGHKDVIRAIYHDSRNEAVYTGSEDGVLAGWSLSSLASRLRVGDADVDDDGGDGREDVESDDEGDEESEIESESESEMDVDSEDEEMEGGYRNGPILGGRGAEKARPMKRQREARRDKRPNPY